MSTYQAERSTPEAVADDLNLVDLVCMVGRQWRLVLAGSLLAGLTAFAASFLMTPVFTARTTLIPPQGNGGAMLGAALSSLGPFAGLAANSASGRSGDTYMALLRSRTLGDRLVEHHQLKDLYNVRFNFEALEALQNRTRIEYNKKEGVITIEFDDSDPVRAALIANDYVSQLKVMSGAMTLTENQRRRAFFEAQLQESRKRLAAAQGALQASGFDQAAMRVEPRVAVEEYARVKADLATTQVRLKEVSSRLAAGAPEIQSLNATAAALRNQLKLLEQASDPRHTENYVARYREFKYQESLHEQLAKQFEAARLEESREDSTLQVIDIAQPPEWKSKPKRSAIGLAASLLAALFLSAGIIFRQLRGLGRPLPYARS